MHSFLNAVLKRHSNLEIPVALFPCGTGNAFNLDIGCTTIDETLECIFRNDQSYIDVAEVNCGTQRLWSFNILGCGLVAEINKLAENLRWMGASRYTVASLIKLIGNPSTQLSISTGQTKIDGRFSFVLACNTRYTGKGMMMAPNAKLKDGKFDVIVVKSCSALKLLRLFPKIFQGKHLGADVVQYLQTDVLEVSSGARNLPANIDGELNGHTPFTLTVRPDKIKVFMKV
jgi:diacylglycerol kinase family enzyme